VQIFIHSHAQFEDDTLGNIQPVKVMVEDVTRPLSNFRVPVMTRAAAFKTRETTSSPADVVRRFNHEAYDVGGGEARLRATS